MLALALTEPLSVAAGPPSLVLVLILTPALQLWHTTTCKQDICYITIIITGFRGDTLGEPSSRQLMPSVCLFCLSAAAFKELSHCSYDFTIWASTSPANHSVSARATTTTHTHTHTHTYTGTCAHRHTYSALHKLHGSISPPQRTGHWALPVSTCLLTLAGCATSSCKPRKITRSIHACSTQALQQVILLGC